jgi:threonine 3-dehydrogenase
VSDVETIRAIPVPESMSALVYDRAEGSWEETRGLTKVEVASPELVSGVGTDEASVIIRPLYAGFCGSDRGIWFRKAFKDMICGSLDVESRDQRVIGHEMLGEIVAAGRRAQRKYGYFPGDIVSTESHIICGACFQCRVGDTHVCAEDKIIGISLDGCFSDYIKLPAKSLWRTDLTKIRPEVAAVQEPFGNAVHACTKVDLRGKTVAIFGTGTIGLFAVLVARGLGAGRILGIDPNPRHAAMAAKLGADDVLQPDVSGADPIASDAAVTEWVRKATKGLGADVTLEMSGYNSALNNAIGSTRRGGDVILFGIRDGQMVIDDFGKLVMNGIALHSVVGRQIFETWTVTRSLLEDKSNRIQDLIWEVILNKGEGTVVDFADWEKAAFEQSISQHPKMVLRIGGDPVLN